MDNIKTWTYEKFTDIVTYVSGPATISKFLEEGTLTPEEFVQAGDLLVLKCPTWMWVGNSKSPQKGLPLDKQYLLTRNVPCQMRVKAFETQTTQSENTNIIEDGEDWVATHTNEDKEDDNDIIEIPSNNNNNNFKNKKNNNEEEEEEDDEDEEVAEIDLSDLSITNNKNKGEEDEIEEEYKDPSILRSNNVVKTRTYDITICYDQYHQTPRVWLFGYNENNEPLLPEQVLQDISQEHVNKTVTIASHPHTLIPQAYIHPCKHAIVMKKILQRMKDADKILRVDQYLFIFLKFIHAAIPTIEYDYTIEMSLDK